LILGGAAVHRCDNSVAFAAGFSPRGGFRWAGWENNLFMEAIVSALGITEISAMG
jgi:hypothetical protein